MAAFNFPNSPSTNDIHNENGVSWKWNGAVWKKIGTVANTFDQINVVGVSTFGGKVGIADSIVHTGNENTSIRFPSTSELTVETGGAERFRIDSIGRVGVGTASPKTSFEVRDAKANVVIAKDGLTIKQNNDIATSYDLLQIGAGGALASYSVATVTADTQFIHNAYRHSGNNWKYRYADSAARIRMNSPQGAIIFDNAAAGSADGDITFSERLRIDTNGNITAVNTTSGATTGVTLKIGASASTGTNSGTIIINNGGTGDGALQFDYEGSAARGRIWMYRSTQDLIFDTAGSERLRITSDGQFNFTSNKSSGYVAKFTQTHADNPAEIWIDSPADNNLRPAYIQLKNAGTDKWGIGQVYQSTQSGAFHISTGGHSQASSKLMITTGGEFHVGNIDVTKGWGVHSIARAGNNDATFAVPATLNIAGGTAYSTANMAGGGIRFVGKYDSSNNYTTFAHVAGVKENTTNGDYGGALLFHTRVNGGDGAERMRIRSDGHVIIDTTRNGYGGLKIYDDSSGDYHVRYIAGRNQGATAHVFMRGGRAQNNTTWVDATATEHARIHRSGISFGGDTAAANTLNDYEEGSWTPTPDNLTNTPQYYNRVGNYTKIGNMVYAIGFLQFGGSPAPQFSSTGSHLTVSGLPFPCDAGTGYVGCVGAVTYQSMNWSGSPYNDYSATSKIIAGANSSSKTTFRVDGTNNTIRGTLKREAWHNSSCIITWELAYRTNS